MRCIFTANEMPTQFAILNEEVTPAQKAVEDCSTWMRRRTFKSKGEAIQEAVREADFSKEAATKAADNVYNAGSVTHAGGPKENPVAFTHCKTCGEGISGTSAKGHETHDVEVVHKIHNSEKICVQCEKSKATTSTGMCTDCESEFIKTHPEAYRQNADRPPTEQEVMEKHVLDKHGGKMQECKKCEKTVMGNAGAWPMSLKCSFIEPGVVNYADVGMVLVRKEVLDKMANSFIGKPVVNQDHRGVKPEEFKEGTVDGIINTVWFDSNDAMFHCAYQVWDQPTLKNIKQGYKVSCAYNVTRWGPGGIHNNVPYEREVLEGEYTHLAIVPNPRYEGVRIYNSKGAKNMTLQWFRKLLGTDGKEIENSIQVDSSKSVVELDGKEVPLDEMINAFKAAEEKKRKELENRAPADDDLIDIGGGKKVSVADLKNAYKAKNDDEEEEKKKKKAKDDEDEKERKNAAAKAAADQLQNDLAREHKAGKHDGKELEACGLCNELKNARGRTHFETVDRLANSREGDFTDALPTHVDGFELGRTKFGSAPAAKK